MQKTWIIKNVPIVVAALLLVGQPVRGQSAPEEESVAKPEASESADRSDAAKAKKAFEKSVAKYRSLKSYQHKSTTKFNLETEGSLPFGMGIGQEQEGTLKFARPNRIAMVSSQMEVFSDGKHMWKVMKMIGQYTETDATDPLDL